MHLILILLAIVSFLTFLSGLIVFFGASKGDRIRSAWYFLAALFATIWMGSIGAFIVATPESAGTIGWHVNWVFISAIFIDTAFLGYSAWKRKYGKIATLLFLAVGLAISIVIAVNPYLLYSEIILSNTGNKIIMNFELLYFLYIGFFCLIVPVIAGFFLKQFFKTKSKNQRRGDLMTMVSFATSSVVVVIFDLILPFFRNWDLVWLGPLALAATIIGVYYTILRYRMLNLASIWLRIFSYIVVLSSIAMVYMIIFSVIFAALFRGSTPSTEVIVLNFIMILIFLSLMPAMNGLIIFIRSLISGNNSKKKENLNE